MSCAIITGQHLANIGQSYTHTITAKPSSLQKIDPESQPEDMQADEPAAPLKVL